MATRRSARTIKSVAPGLGDVVGSRGEIIFELAITDYSQFRFPLFRPAFLGAKWPTIDYEVWSNKAGPLTFQIARAYGKAKYNLVHST